MKTAADDCGPGPTEASLFSRTARTGRCPARPAGVPSRPDRALQIWAIVEDREGGLWIGTSWGLVRRLKDGRMIDWPFNPRRVLTMSGRCSSTVNRESGLATRLESLCSAPGLSTEPFEPRSSNSRVEDIGKVTLPAIAGAAARYTTQDGVSGGMVRALLQSSDGQVWIATLDGVTQFDGGISDRSPKPMASRARRRSPRTAMATSGLEPQPVARCGSRGMGSPPIRKLTVLPAPLFAQCCKAPRESFTPSASTSISIGSTEPGLPRFG